MKTNIFTLILILSLSVSLYSQVVVNDEYFYKQWYLNMPGTDATRADIRVLDAWTRTMGNANQKIADIEGDDSGLNGYPSTNHPDLIGRITTQGQGFTGEHSTNVSGLLVANHNTIGIAGLNKYAQLRSYLFPSEDNQQWADKVRDARLDGNKIINISQGKYESMPSVAIRLMEAHNSNIVTVISAGNNNSSISNPGSFAGVITVGASTKDNTSAIYSNYGSKLNFLAPGGSTLLDPTNDKNIYTTFSNGSYKYASGTSMAAPIVAGASSLLLAYKPDLTNEDVKNILINSCDKLREMNGNDFTNKCGYGRINLKKAMELLEPPYALTHGNATLTKLKDNEKYWFTGNPVLASGPYFVDMYKLSVNKNDLNYLETPLAWLPKGYYPDNPNNSQEFIYVSATNTLVDTYTFFYYIRYDESGHAINMWVPYDPTGFIYTILGKPTIINVPEEYPTISSALAAAVFGQTISVTGQQTITSNLIVPSGITLTIKSNTILNINGHTIIATGGSIIVESGASINGALLKTGSTVNAIYPSIESALSVATSGKTVETWGSQNISNNITVNSGITLLVKPNVTLTFSSGKRLNIAGSGTLTANNATFQGNGTAGSWYALYFYANSYGSFQSCTIKDAQCGVYSNTVTNLTVSNSTIENSSLYGFSLINSTATISNCTIQNNGTGINSSSSRPAITGCTIQNNTNYGISASNISPNQPHLFWYDNTFSGNGYAILLNNASPYLHNNDIFDNNHSIQITSSYTNFADPSNNWRGYNEISCSATPLFRAENYSSVYAGYGPPDGMDAGGYNSIFGSELPDMEAYNHSNIYACNNYWGSPYPAINVDGTSTILAWYPLSSDPNPGSCALNKSSYLAKSSTSIDGSDLSKIYFQAISGGFENNFSTAKGLLKSIIENKFDSKYTPLALLEYYNLNIKDKDLNGSNATYYSDNILESVYNRDKKDSLRPFAVRLLAREAALNGKPDEMISYNTEIIDNYPNSSNEVSALYDLVNYYYEIEDDNTTASKYLKRMDEAYPKNDLTLFAKVNLGLSTFDLKKSGETSIEQVPDKYSLGDNYPNPFNPSTTIKFQLPKDGFVTLKVYDILGKEITTLLNEEKSQGKYEVTFDASNLSSGVYIYKMQAGDFVSSKKMILLK